MKRPKQRLTGMNKWTSRKGQMMFLSVISIEKTRITRTAVFLGALVVILASCKSSSVLDKPPAPAVTVSVPVRQMVTEWDEYSGRLESPQTVSLTARVSGVIERAPFQEGALVQAGQELFLIDERPFRADFMAKQAEVSRAESQVSQAAAHFRRFEKLQGTKAISEEDFDEAAEQVKQAKALLVAARAAADLSRLNLEWTKVTAPISGRVSWKYVTEGNLVSGGVGQGTQLTTITSIDPMYASVSVPERSLLRYRSLHRGEVLEGGESRPVVPCAVKLENEIGFQHQGTVNLIDGRIDPSTGTARVRCALPNQDASLLAGLFVRLRIPGSEEYSALLVPDVAVGTDQNSKFVFVVNSENVVQVKPVKLGALFGKLRAVMSGLAGDEKIIVSGIQAARPGVSVQPSEAPISPEALQEVNVKSSLQNVPMLAKTQNQNSPSAQNEKPLLKSAEIQK